MSDAARMRRLARAQQALADVAAARAAMAWRAHVESAAEADAIVAALNSESPLHGISVPLMAGALRRNGRTTERLRREAEVAAAVHRREDRAAATLGERAREAERHARAAAERQRIEVLAATWKRRP